MKIGLIGCGRVGLTFGYFLKRQNLLYGVYDRNQHALNRALKLLKIKNNPGYKNLIEKSEILLIATPDSEISNAFNQARKYITEKKYIFHFSGLFPGEIFSDDKFICSASVHPFATFPRIVIPPKKRRYNLFFQGCGECLAIARRIFPEWMFSIYKIDKVEKPYYHLLGVFSSNFIVGLMDAIQTITKKLGWSKKEFERFVLPIIFDTLDNIQKYGVKKGLSGPIVRGDIKTIKKHLETLKDYPEHYGIYCAISRVLIKYAPGKFQKKLKKIFKVN